MNCFGHSCQILECGLVGFSPVEATALATSRAWVESHFVWNFGSLSCVNSAFHAVQIRQYKVEENGIVGA